MSRSLVLIDANALIHRAFHALPQLKTKNGQPIQAVYGFFSLFFKMFKEIKPSYLAVAFDRPEETFRHKEFVEYKAQRPKTPEELISQIPIVKEILYAFGVPILEKVGYEADDIIGSLVEKFKDNKKIEKVIIVTGDLDSLQLVKNEKVLVWTLKTGLSQSIVYDEKKVRKRFALEPANLVDFKALKGDPSDNIPGVPGIGEKTAQKLIAKFKTLENLYQKLEKEPEEFADFPKKVISSLKENKEKAFFSKKLIALRLDLGLKISFGDLTLKINQKKIKELFQKYEFNTLWQRFLEIFSPEKKKKQESLIF